MDRQNTAQCQDRIYYREVVLWRGSSARKLEPPATYRLGADLEGGWRNPRKVTGWENFQWLSDPPEIMA
jgi:hypothetical protein